MKKLAFLILAHTDPVHLGRLCRALDHDARIFVHLDAKVDMAPFLAQSLPSSVRFIDDQVTVSWAAYSQVEATLRMMRAALSCGEDFSHLVMLSGQDYPIKSMTTLHRHLAGRSQHEFIRFVDATDSPHYGVYFKHYWFMDAHAWLPRKLDRHLRHGVGRVLRLVLKKPMPDCIGKVCWGSAYWAITPLAARHVLDFIDTHPEYLRWARTSFAVDEHFFHSILGNSGLLAHTDGFCPATGPGNVTFQQASLHLIHPSMRRVYTESDLDALLATDKFFVRKLATGQSDALIQRLNI